MPKIGTGRRERVEYRPFPLSPESSAIRRDCSGVGSPERLNDIGFLRQGREHPVGGTAFRNPGDDAPRNHNKSGQSIRGPVPYRAISEEFDWFDAAI